MKRHINIEYSGNCPSCGSDQCSSKPEDVDKLCWGCEAQNGIVRLIKMNKGYGLKELGTSIVIVIETANRIMTITSYNPEEPHFNNKEDFDKLKEYLYKSPIRV